MVKQALSARGVSEAYGIDRARISAAIADGELSASRLGKRRYVVMVRDVETWLRSYAVRPSLHAEKTVQRRLEHEERAGVG